LADCQLRKGCGVALLMLVCIALVALLDAISTWSQGAVAWFYLTAFS